MEVLRELKSVLVKLSSKKVDHNTKELLGRAVAYLDMAIREREKTVDAIRAAHRAELE